MSLITYNRAKKYTDTKTDFYKFNQLFNKNNVTVGKAFVDNTGNLISNANWSVSDFMPVKAGDTVYLHGYAKYQMLYDTNQMPIPSTFVNTSLTKRAFSVGQDGFYRFSFISNPATEGYQNPDDIRVYLNVDEDAVFFTRGVVLRSSDWLGKNMVIFGDSIQWQDGRPYSGSGLIAKGMGTIIKEKLGFRTYDNQGLSGRPMANGTPNGDGTNTTIRNYSAFGDKHLAIIAAGTNDFKLNVQLGTLGNIGDTTFDNTTFYGAYREAIEHMLAQNTALKIVLLTPLQRNNGGYNGWDTVNAVGKKLIDYRNAIIELGLMYSLPVCDLFSASGINKFNLSNYTTDGLHPNDSGYAFYSGYVASFINGVAPAITM